MRIAALLLCLAGLPASTQPLLTPTAASTRLYFAQLADGGPASQKWTTTLLFVNPSSTSSAAINVSFYADSGQPLALDFGQGAHASLTVNVPVSGTATVTSAGASATTAIGWALAVANTPVLGTVIYRAVQNGLPALDVAASGSGTTYLYTSFATRDLGVALANPSGTDTAHLTVTGRDPSGAASGAKTFVVPPNGHLAFNVGQQISGLASGLAGSITIVSSDSPALPFIAWTVNSRDGLLAPLPSGEVSSPPPYDRRVYDAHARVGATVAPLIQVIAKTPGTFVNKTPAQVIQIMNGIGLSIDAGDAINATFQLADRKVHLTQAMLEMLGNNEAAMAFIIARCEVLGYVAITGDEPDLGILVDSPETAAEFWGLAVVMKAGYDPGGAMDFLNRIWAATSEGTPVDAQLLAALNVPSGLAMRLQRIREALTQFCGTGSPLATDCQAVHALWHPHFPAQLP
jgi:hypothetical protein